MSYDVNRRDAIKALGGWLAFLSSCRSNRSTRTLHPHIYITDKERESLRSIAHLRRSICSGLSAQIWNNIVRKVEADAKAAILTPASLFDGRDPDSAKHKNPDYTICHAAGQRVLRAALVHLIKGDASSKKTALDQLYALFDESVWPPWIDHAHLRFGHPADLRTGMLSRDVALAYDWLYGSLTSEERQWIAAGVTKRGFQPFLKSIDQDPWWIHDLNNWLTVIVGGVGIAGMAVGGDHAAALKCVDISKPLLKKYLTIYGAEGEFNESVAYSNSTLYPVAYYLACYYHENGGENRLARFPFPQTCLWTLFSTLPPGRYAAFGDCHTEAAPKVAHIAAVASASDDPALQWFYLQHAKNSSDPLQLLWYNPALKAVSPQHRLSLGKVYYDNGMQVFSRSDWKTQNAGMVVYGKAGREHNHAHNDVGQVCIDANDRRMIVDLGAPSGYPADFFDENRWKYYNASIRGHNVLMFGNREQRFPPHDRGKKTEIDFKAFSAKFLLSHFDDQWGGYWQLDLSRAYDAVLGVYRTVIHLFPGIAVIYDCARLKQTEAISLRWHVMEALELQRNGCFLVKNNNALLSGRILSLNPENAVITKEKHQYRSPFNRNRLGEPLQQRNEKFVQARLTAKSCRLLSLFAVLPAGSVSFWQRNATRWTITNGDCCAQVYFEKDRLTVKNRKSGHFFSVPI